MIYVGNCLDIMPTLDENSVDSIVTDPPYGLEFMGKDWDHGVPGKHFWIEALRVAKPGAYLLAFGGTRTFHRLACAIEDAGWEIRDTIMWVYGSGFPKSLDIGKAIDKLQGNERTIVGVSKNEKDFRDIGKKVKEIEGIDKLSFGLVENCERKDIELTVGSSKWEGWGTSLKPAWEPIIVARKPIKGTVAENVLKYGTGGLNIDGCRVELEDDCRLLKGGTYGDNRGSDKGTSMFGTNQKDIDYPVRTEGRFPANLIHDGSDEALAVFPNTSPSKAAPRGGTNPNPMDWGNARFDGDIIKGHDDNGGSAARFFYCAKASKQDRDEGCESLIDKISGAYGQFAGDGRGRQTEHQPAKNHHPTVKPTSLMRYLCRLVTPPNGTILDPFMGSGSTGKAAALEGFNFIGIELDQDYANIAQSRIDHVMKSKITANAEFDF
jgi:site-specific DNA-methyltransferase (adenine-specific)